eukprot:NODE_3945_length_890_cov_22.322235_g3633_i0.p1 GENE.NODE_3945_length_890_cov_22.322235_g3633_i0~~NODE_3945_length_890_cov_22.322235_g3633_i0.p1  ORF type:complete len:231 (-),score=23.23 NODE_3945_length_890_cov_22.322235_g3633_i0:51-743(-)
MASPTIIATTVLLRMIPGVSNIVRTALLGKHIRLLEYPECKSPRTILIRRTSLQHLKRVIARTQNPPFEESAIIGLATFVPPHFTQPVQTNQDSRFIFNREWVLWSRTVSIPVHFKPEVTRVQSLEAATSATLFVKRHDHPLCQPFTIALPPDRATLPALHAQIAAALRADGCITENFVYGVTHAKFPNVMVPLEDGNQLFDGCVITLLPKTLGSGPDVRCVGTLGVNAV